MTSERFPLGASTWVEWHRDYLHLQFAGDHWALSSAVLNGGLRPIRHLLNLKVSADESTPLPPPDFTLQAFADERGWQGTCVGMMTAASMNSLRVAQWREQDVEISVLVTTGLANARCAGDPAEWRFMGAGPDCLGTINLVIFINARLTDAALVEAVMLATEAKVHALRHCGVRSPVSGEPATGTGTDAVAVVCGHDEPLIAYCGKHVLLGERLAGLVRAAVKSSLDWRGFRPMATF